MLNVLDFSKTENGQLKLNTSNIVNLFRILVLGFDSYQNGKYRNNLFVLPDSLITEYTSLAFVDHGTTVTLTKSDIEKILSDPQILQAFEDSDLNGVTSMNLSALFNDVKQSNTYMKGIKDEITTISAAIGQNKEDKKTGLYAAIDGISEFVGTEVSELKSQLTGTEESVMTEIDTVKDKLTGDTDSVVSEITSVINDVKASINGEDETSLINAIKTSVDNLSEQIEAVTEKIISDDEDAITLTTRISNVATSLGEVVSSLDSINSAIVKIDPDDSIESLQECILKIKNLLLAKQQLEEGEVDSSIEAILTDTQAAANAIKDEITRTQSRYEELATNFDSLVGDFRQDVVDTFNTNWIGTMASTYSEIVSRWYESYVATNFTQLAGKLIEKVQSQIEQDTVAKLETLNMQETMTAYVGQLNDIVEQCSDFANIYSELRENVIAYQNLVREQYKDQKNVTSLAEGLDSVKAVTDKMYELLNNTTKMLSEQKQMDRTLSIANTVANAVSAVGAFSQGTALSNKQKDDHYKLLADISRQGTR